MLSSRSAFRVSLPTGTLVVLLALIGWGLQYKTSLYYHIFHVSPEPPAKLLSDAERPATERCAVKSNGLASAVGKVRARNASYYCALAAGSYGNPTRDEDPLLLVPRVVISSFHHPRTRFFLRPPPLS